MSPVVAAIILIAVTVAVSIAVAAWMGALTFTWMGYEEIQIAKCEWTWGLTGNRYAKITITNTGTKDVTISQVKVNHMAMTLDQVVPDPPFSFKTGQTTNNEITITWDYVNGTAYDIGVATSSGHEFTKLFTGGQDIT